MASRTLFDLVSEKTIVYNPPPEVKSGRKIEGKTERMVQFVEEPLDTLGEVNSMSLLGLHFT